jgi:uncharacterized protein YciI
MYEFLIIAPDTPNSLQTRLDTRPQHFAGLKSLIADKKVTWGGAMLHNPPADESKPEEYEFAGSAMTVRAESREAAMEIVKSDPYVKAGVWDLEKMQVYAVSDTLGGDGTIGTGVG